MEASNQTVQHDSSQRPERPPLQVQRAYALPGTGPSFTLAAGVTLCPIILGVSQTVAEILGRNSPTRHNRPIVDFES